MASEFLSLIPYCDGTTLGQLNCWVTDKAAETALVSGMVGAGAYYLGWRRASNGLKVLANGRYEGSECILSHTRYDKQPDGTFVQRIRGVQGPNRTGVIKLETEGLFHGDVKDVAVDIILKASEYCTPDNPVVFDHLCKVRIGLTGKRVNQQQAAEIISQWRQYWGAAAMDSALDGVQTQPNGQNNGENIIYPVLVNEVDDNIRKKQLRVLFMPIWKINDPATLPPLEKVVVENGPGQTDADRNHPHLDRLKTERAVVRVVNDNKLLQQKLWVGVPHSHGMAPAR